MIISYLDITYEGGEAPKNLESWKVSSKFVEGEFKIRGRGFQLSQIIFQLSEIMLQFFSR